MHTWPKEGEIDWSYLHTFVYLKSNTDNPAANFKRFQRTSTMKACRGTASSSNPEPAISGYSSRVALLRDPVIDCGAFSAVMTTPSLGSRIVNLFFSRPSKPANRPKLSSASQRFLARGR